MQHFSLAILLESQDELELAGEVLLRSTRLKSAYIVVGNMKPAPGASGQESHGAEATRLYMECLGFCLLGDAGVASFSRKFKGELSSTLRPGCGTLPTLLTSVIALLS